MLKHQLLTGHWRKSVCLTRTGVTGHACEHRFKYIRDLGLESWLNTNPSNNANQMKFSKLCSRWVISPQLHFFFNKRSVYFCRTGLMTMVFLCSFGMCLVWSNLGDHAAHSKSLTLVCPFAVLYQCSRAIGEGGLFTKISIALRGLLRLWHSLLI